MLRTKFLLKKKKLLETAVVIEKVRFAPSIGLDGFKVTSSFDVEEISCGDLNNEVYQLGVILHPPEIVNEKFLIKLRDCFLNLSETHPLKRWTKWMSQSRPLGKDALATQEFLTGIINSQFNLITDAKVKNQIIKLLYVLPEATLSERVLKSYLYLMLGNVARSDNLLRGFVNSTPKVNWQKSGIQGSFYHTLGKNFFQQLMTKLAKHPADRRTFELFCLYLRKYYNDDGLLKLVNDFDSEKVEKGLDLRYTEALAPEFVHFLRLERMGETRRINALRKLDRFPLSEQSYWVWPFLDIEPLISSDTNAELLRIEKEDELWFIYLMEDEKLADFFSKKHGKSFLPGRRPFLKASLGQPETFMMGLYKLIQLGDINSDLVLKATNFVTHE